MALDLDVIELSYIEGIAEQIKSKLDPDSLPSGPTDGLLFCYAALVLTVGEAVTLENVHDTWSAWMLGVDPTHEAIRPFSELDDATAAMDEPFAHAIRLVAAELGAG